MNIKIIEPYDLNTRYDIRSLTPNLGPVVIASLLKEKGHDVEVISEYISDLNVEDLQGADLVGISIPTYNAKKGYRIARHIKKPVVFGGFHASLAPEECLGYGNYVIKGDGHSIVDLADFLSGKGRNDIDRIPNLVYKKSGRIHYNQRETGAINVVPDFSLIRDYYKLNFNRLLRIPLLVNASRGCHYRCAFCAIVEIYPDLKKKDAEILIKDIKSQISKQHFLSRFLPRVVCITDDNFFSDRRWAKDVLLELSKLKTNYQFVMQARVDIAYDDELLALMKKANVGRVYVGIESLNQESLDKFDKEFSLEDIDYAVKRIRQYGIDIFGLFVFGDDEFRKGDGLRIAEFARRHRFSGVLIQPLTPYPGTALFKKFKEEGRILHEEWQEYNGKVVFIPKNLTAAELQKEIYQCYRKVYSPFRVIKFLLLGNKEFKLGVLGEAIFRHIEWIKSRTYIKERLSVKKNTHGHMVAGKALEPHG